MALPGGEGGGAGVGVGVVPPVLAGGGAGGGVGVDGPLSVPATALPCPSVRLEVPVKGVDGSSRLQPATNAIAANSGAER